MRDETIRIIKSLLRQDVNQKQEGLLRAVAYCDESATGVAQRRAYREAYLAYEDFLNHEMKVADGEQSKEGDTTWICDHCGGEYDSDAECSRCEMKHRLRLTIIGMVHRPGCGFPAEITVRDERDDMTKTYVEAYK